MKIESDRCNIKITIPVVDNITDNLWVDLTRNKKMVYHTTNLYTNKGRLSLLVINRLGMKA